MQNDMIARLTMAPITIAAANLKLASRLANGQRWSDAFEAYFRDLPFHAEISQAANDPGQMASDVVDAVESTTRKSVRKGTDFAAKVAEDMADATTDAMPQTGTRN